VGVPVGVTVGVGLLVLVGVGVTVGVSVGVPVSVGVIVMVGVSVMVAVAVQVGAGVGVGRGVGSSAADTPARSVANPTATKTAAAIQPASLRTLAEPAIYCALCHWISNFCSPFWQPLLVSKTMVGVLGTPFSST
jgi:hypothetical protein